MLYKESLTVELKREFTNDLKKEVVAFANSEGGKIYLGIDDDGDNFEEARSLNQELTFKTAVYEFNKRRLELGKMQMRTLGMITTDNIYTNLGLLLSDQCVHTLKVAVFYGDDKSDFKDRREFTGSLLKQLKDAYEYIDIYNKTSAEFSGIDRIDKRDYSEKAIREALINAIIHRDYSFSGSTLVNIYSDRIEFISLGGLVKGITINDIMLGISQPRNEKLAAIFYRLKLIEAYGTGIVKIMDTYKGLPFSPTLHASDNAFMISLPNLNSRHNKVSEKSNEQIVLEYLNKNKGLKRKDVEGLFGISQTAAGRILRNMVKEGQIKQVGSSQNTKYVLM